MNRSKLLESYKNGELPISDETQSDQVTNGMKDLIINFISEKFVETNISDEKTKERFNKNLIKNIKKEYNTLTIPYFYLLESLNLCIEVEMSDNQTKFIDNQKFGEKKLSEILSNGGFETPNPIKKFAISENIFLNEISSVVKLYTPNVEITDDSIKIEIL